MMKIKKIFIGLGILIAILIMMGIYQLSTFKLFDDDISVIENFNVPNKNYSINICHIPPNATTQSYLQVRKIQNGVEEVIDSYERFNCLVSYSINGDTLALSIREANILTAKTEIKKLVLPQ